MVDTASMQLFIRLRVKVDANDCWIWQCWIEHHGYGRTSFRGHRGYTHRLAYEAFVGPVPDGLEIDHLCRVRACCNPQHLEAVTRTVNMRRRMPGYDNEDQRFCGRGHAMTPENIYHRGGKCRECLRAAWRRANARRKGAVLAEATS